MFESVTRQAKAAQVWTALQPAEMVRIFWAQPVWLER